MKMKHVKLFICPSTKNITDAVLRFCENGKHIVGLIPTRRQVEWNGGYANNWTTKDFSAYATNLLLERDHSGPGQGYTEDDGYESLSHDCNYFDLIHIDPWKEYPKYKEGLQWTVDMVEFCYNKNPSLKYEIGTEEGIRPFEAMELQRFITDLRARLKPSVFNRLEYIVIQSGTLIEENINQGSYNPNKLKQMIAVAQVNNLLSKEHNGDYLGPILIKEKMKLGLDSVNLGPEFALIETKTYLDNISATNNPTLFEKFWRLCYDSGRWKRWVNDDFDPAHNKHKLIEICGHYIFSNPIFISEIKNSFKDIDKHIQTNIINLLESYYDA